MPTETAYAHPVEDFEFVPVTEHHLATIHEWLSRPHVAKWWGDPDKEIGNVRDMLAGRDSTRPFIFRLGDQSLGYIQFWSVGDAQQSDWIEKEPWLADLPSDAVGIDVMIADTGQLSRGVGSSVLRAFADRLLGEGHKNIIIDPDPANARAVRAYEKAGFSAQSEHVGEDGRTLIMTYKPTKAGPNA